MSAETFGLEEETSRPNHQTDVVYHQAMYDYQAPLSPPIRLQRGYQLDPVFHRPVSDQLVQPNVPLDATHGFHGPKIHSHHVSGTESRLYGPRTTENVDRPFG